MADVACFSLEIQGLERPGDREIAVLAGGQHGVVASFQLTALGLRPGAIEHRLRIGRLHRVYRGVYAVGHTSLSPRGRLMAAALTYGPAAVLSHLSAAWLWGLRPPARQAIDVTAPRSRHPRGRIRVHAVRSLDVDERVLLENIPVTSVARTLFDCAEVTRLRQLERLFEEAERQRLFDLRALETVCVRNPGRRAQRAVRALIKALREPPATRSELERLFLDFCRAFGLPEPVFNAVIGGYEVDAWWPGTCVIVELDSFGFHSSRSAFEADRTKDLDLKIEQFEVIRVTDRRIRTDAPRLARQVQTVLNRAAATRPPSSPSVAA